jgi:hypothetical protein
VAFWALILEKVTVASRVSFIYFHEATKWLLDNMTYLLEANLWPLDRRHKLPRGHKKPIFVNPHWLLKATKRNTPGLCLVIAVAVNGERV